MVIRTNMQRAEWDGLDDLALQAPNAFDSFVVRAPKITLLSTKTVTKEESTSTPTPQFPQTPPDVLRRRGQHTNDSKRRLLPHSSIANVEESSKIPVRIAIVSCDCNDCMALRRAVSYVDPPPPQESVHLRESRLCRDKAAVIALLHARSRRLSLQSASEAATRHASRASGWGLVGWGKYRIAYSRMVCDTIATSGAKRCVVAKRSCST